MFNYVLKAVNSDGNYPKVVQPFLPRHRWFNMDVPGSRQSGDNPDNIYRLVPISPGARYEVLGQRPARPAAHTSFTLVGNMGTSETLAQLDWKDVNLDDLGNYVLAINDDPCGDSNHLLNQRGVLFLWVRHTMTDWKQDADWLTVRRLDPPTAAPLSVDELAEYAARCLVTDVPLAYWFMRLALARPLNVMAPAYGAGGVGGLVTQIGSQGHFKFADDEAVIVRVQGGGADYHGFVAHDMWFRSIEYWQRTSSLNNHQLVPDPGGGFTLVVCAKDPGVHNWIDTGGLHEILAIHRWQGLPQNTVDRPQASITSEHVKLSEIPADLPRVTLEQRRAQQAQRLAEYKRRLIDR